MSFAIFVLWSTAYAVLLAQMPLATVTWLIGFPICVWLSNLLHELAHLMAYLCLRIPFKRLRIAWFLFWKENNVLHFRFDGKAMPFLGECACAYDRKIPFWKYCTALVSGGLSCAIVCPIAIVLSFPQEGATDAFLLCLGIATGLNAAVNLLYPFSTDMTLLRGVYKKSAE